jgi:two-component system sensor histidine kinase PilS (NtrC family)
MTWSNGMGPRAAMPADATSGGDPGWGALQQLVLSRVLVASLALPFGILLRPGQLPHPTQLLWTAVGLVAAVTAVSVAGLRLARGRTVQLFLQVAMDLAVVTWLAAETGGRDSQFVLFYALVVITGGVFTRVAGGLFAAAGACAGFLALPWLSAGAGVAPPPEAMLPKPEMLVSFFTMVGVLAGVLGERVHRTRGDLERTARELNRVRIDNDIVLRHLATGVFAVDHHGVVGYLNPAAESVLGTRVIEARGRHVSMALPERLSPLRDIVLETLRGGQGRARAELTLAGPTGRPLPIGISTNVLTHEGELTGVVAVFQDLTEVREMERRVRRNETLAEVGALAAGIAHELRNGLKPIAGSVEYLQRELALKGEEAQLMDLIARESARLNKFVTDLLAYSRERDLAVESVDLGNHLREVVSVLRHDPRGGNVEFRVECPPDAIRVLVDPEMMRQVWLNLAANALESMEGRGTLTLRWSGPDDGLATVDFEDTGAGIAAEDLPRVGEPFFTTKRGGTGLGLAIAQRIVERHGGVLILESESGRGTTARVQLPVPVEAEAAVA